MVVLGHVRYISTASDDDDDDSIIFSGQTS